MSESRPTSGKWLACGLAIVLLYPLSIGPANWVFKWTGATWIQSAYKPLDIAANAWNPLGRALSRYRNLWGFP
jgi:hypothetical protein